MPPKQLPPGRPRKREQTTTFGALLVSVIVAAAEEGVLKVTVKVLLSAAVNLGRRGRDSGSERGRGYEPKPGLEIATTALVAAGQSEGQILRAVLLGTEGLAVQKGSGIVLRPDEISFESESRQNPAFRQVGDDQLPEIVLCIRQGPPRNHIVRGRYGASQPRHQVGRYSPPDRLN